MLSDGVAIVSWPASPYTKAKHPHSKALLLTRMPVWYMMTRFSDTTIDMECSAME